APATDTATSATANGTNPSAMSLLGSRSGVGVRTPALSMYRSEPSSVPGASVARRTSVNRATAPAARRVVVAGKLSPDGGVVQRGGRVTQTPAAPCGRMSSSLSPPASSCPLWVTVIVKFLSRPGPLPIGAPATDTATSATANGTNPSAMSLLG